MRISLARAAVAKLDPCELAELGLRLSPPTDHIVILAQHRTSAAARIIEGLAAPSGAAA